VGDRSLLRGGGAGGGGDSRGEYVTHGTYSSSVSNIGETH